jgi:hypothetical protein
MENAINISVTPLQALLALAFQAWIIIFPIVLLWKMDRLTRLVEEATAPLDTTDKEDNVKTI